jgi:hypothetical protein
MWTIAHGLVNIAKRNPGRLSKGGDYGRVSTNMTSIRKRRASQTKAEKRFYYSKGSKLSQTQLSELTEADIAVDKDLEDLRPYQYRPLSAADKVFVMQGWNKALAFKTTFSEKGC